MADNGLTQTEQRKLQHHEQQIAQGASNVYQSLRVIHDQKLYRGAHATFEDYCRERWGMSDRHARNLLKHGQILRAIEDSEDPKTGTIVPKILESHTREVSDLPPEEAAQVLVETAKKTDGKITAQAVRETRGNGEADPFGVEEPSPGEERSGGQEAPQDSSPRPPRKGKGKSGGSVVKPARPLTREEQFKHQKALTIKRAEYLIRDFDDLNALQKMPEWHETAIFEAKSLLSKAQNWKYAER